MSNNIPPVLFIVFNRPKETSLVFSEIRKAKPTKLYIAADGPRKHRPNEDQACKSVREIFANVDWDCTVKTLFQEENLGCAKAMGSAVNWFFEFEEEGIILEDDCIPSPSLFRFCFELLQYYRYDQRVGSIIGWNELGAYNDCKDSSYLFFNRYSSWGSATWRHKFKKLYNPKLINSLDRSVEKNILNKSISFLDYIMLREMIFAVKSSKVSSFAWPFSLAHRLNDMVVVCPKVNLIKNIGFGSGTHTLEKKEEDVRIYEMEFPLRHPSYIHVDKPFTDKWILKFNGGYFKILLRHYFYKVKTFVLIKDYLKKLWR